MKKILFLLVGTLFLSTTNANVHKFYISLTEINKNTETNKLEISVKVFYDDLQNAILVEEGKKIDDPLKDHKDIIETYLGRHFQIKNGNNLIKLKFLGTETEVDAVWCHFESEPIQQSIKDLSILNNVFVDLFPTQTNIINFYPEKGNSKKVQGLLLNQRKEIGSIKLK